MPTIRVDDVDRALIRALQEDGRAPAAALATRIGLSDDAVRDRVRRLIDGGVLRITAYVDGAARGLGAVAMVGLRIAGDLRAAMDCLHEVQEITWLGCVGGRFDMFADTMCRDMDHLFETVNDRIRRLDCVISADLFVCLETTKWRDAGSGHLPIRHEARPEQPVPDDLDRRLIARLEHDGRASFRDLATAAGVAYDVVRRRVSSLLDSGVVTIVTIVDRRVSGRTQPALVGIRVSGPVPPVLERLAAVPAVDMAVFVTGTFDIICEVGCRDVRHLGEVVGTDIRKLPGVALTETFSILRMGRAPAAWSPLGPLSEAIVT